MEKKKISRYRWINLAIYMFVSALTQLYWLNFAAIDTYMEKSLNLSAMKISLLTLVFPLVYIFLSIPSGIIIDKKGFKFGVGVGVLFTGIAPLLKVFFPNSFIALLLSQIIIAIGQPFILNGITKLSVTWFPKDEEATAVGLGSLALFIGMIFSLGLTPFIVNTYSYYSMLKFYALLGIIGVIVFFVFVKSKPEFTVRDEEYNESELYLEGIKKLFKIRDFVILGFIAMIGIGVFNGFATWLEKMLNEMHGISMVNAGKVSSMLIFGGIVGSIVIPLISDKVSRRKPFLIIASIMGMINLFLLIILNSLSLNMVNSFVMGFFVISALPIMLIASAEIAGDKYAGISVAYLQLLGNAAAVGIIPLMQLLRESTGSYSSSIALLMALMIIFLVLSVIINETATLNS